MRVLVALDGSTLAERALVAAAPLVTAEGGEIILIEVLDPHAVHSTVSSGGHRVHEPEQRSARLAIRGAPAEPQRALAEDRGQALEAARTGAELELRAAAARCLPPGVTRSIHVEWSDDTAGAIAKCAEDCAANLIAVGTHGRSGLGQVLLGSVTTALVRRSPVPLLVVGESMRLA